MEIFKRMYIFAAKSEILASLSILVKSSVDIPRG